METKTIFIFHLLKVAYVFREGGIKKWWYNSTPIPMNHTQSQEGWGGGVTNLQGKVSVYPVGVLSKRGVWGNLLKGGMGACGGIGGCARGFSGKYSIVP